MTDFSLQLLKIAVSNSLSQAGFARSHEFCIDVLAEVASKYISLLATRCNKSATGSERDHVNFTDVFAVFSEMSIDASLLLEYAQYMNKKEAVFPRIEPALAQVNVDQLALEASTEMQVDEADFLETVDDPAKEWPPRPRLPESEETQVKITQEQLMQSRLQQNSGSLKNDPYCKPILDTRYKIPFKPIDYTPMDTRTSEDLEKVLEIKQYKSPFSFKEYMFAFVQNAKPLLDPPVSGVSMNISTSLLDKMIVVALPKLPAMHLMDKSAVQHKQTAVKIDLGWTKLKTEAEPQPVQPLLIKPTGISSLTEATEQPKIKLKFS